ncbi:Fe-S biogenesis protein NfuA [Sansalvadorimonas sp. 2012CJ34-2]|uniref:Fe/S biogenesis protein NfuA n=1 Tax=Parendozoicomonas callyspongiae TaxID=2942213 RepID=A0ABT0PFP5_9GAMM|nr:Fe-S biogenesis protein NfuA [Sansalvadorimonas sp. 2012CJ34-2]MCL6269831.1 Fe-S biogenesis protein NfuA [Sansalvadorimonas sp. 2012CJ34-2]
MSTAELSIEFTEGAQQYLAELLEKQNVEGIGVRMFVSSPGTPHAETCLAYCKPGEEKGNDVSMKLDAFTAFIEEDSVPYLEEAKVDYAADRMGGQLTIKAPNAKMPKVSDDSPIDQKINYFLQTEINPSLASHGGMVRLVEMDEEGYAILQFGGGCQGCASVDLTLKDGVERTLMERIPELKGVKDMTDHSNTENAYYK